jgi:hypothetical protein
MTDAAVVDSRRVWMAMVTKYRIPRASCAQCGRELKTVPFPITNIILCKDCYGNDRYKRAGAMVLDRQDAPAVEEETSTA